MHVRAEQAFLARERAQLRSDLLELSACVLPAKLLDLRSPRLVVAENPTRGLDIRAAQTISERLRAVAESGAAVVLYSSDLDEVLALSTRILVLHAGQLRECALDRDAVGRAMLGVA